MRHSLSNIPSVMNFITVCSTLIRRMMTNNVEGCNLWRGQVFETDRVAHLLPQSATALLGHTLGHAETGDQKRIRLHGQLGWEPDGGNASRLSDCDFALSEKARFEEILRHLRGFACKRTALGADTEHKAGSKSLPLPVSPMT